MAWGMTVWCIARRNDSSLQINIRAETLAAEGFYGNAKQGRCLIPANGYYEWTKVGHLKVPFYFSLRNHPLFAFAGTVDRTGEHCAIVTTPANEAASGIHDRMPAILSRSQYQNWLSGTGEIPGPYAGDDLIRHPVGQAVNHRFEDDASLIEPLPESREQWW